MLSLSFIRGIKGGQSGGCSHHLFITDPRLKSRPYQSQFGDHLSRAGASLQVDCIIFDSMAPLNHHSPACNPLPCRGDLEDAGAQTDTVLNAAKHMDGKHTRFRLSLMRLDLWLYSCATCVFCLYWLYLSVTTNPAGTLADIREAIMCYSHQLPLVQLLRMRSQIHICTNL